MSNSFKDQYPILRHFDYGHLPMQLQDVSRQFHKVAYDVVEYLPHNPETETVLRKLLEAKDAAVRAAL